MVSNKSKDIFSVTLTICDFVIVLNAVVRTSSDLRELNQTHNAATFSSKCETLALQVTSHLGLPDILFALKLGTFLPIPQCAFSFNLKYIFVSLWK